jgi:hypothetical protein
MNTIKLHKGHIILMLPFRMGPGWAFDSSNTDNGIWIKTDEDVPKLDFLLDHVRDFFVKNTAEGTNDDSSCLITKLKKEAVPFKIFNNKTLWLSNKAFDTHDKVKNLSKLPVSFDPAGFRIIYHPFTSIGVLLSDLELASSGKENEQSTLADFIEMNYLVRLFNRHDEAYFISRNERPEERNKALQLTADKDPGLFENTYQGNTEVTGWRLSHLINYLLHDLNARYKVEFFDHHRFYPVCYAQPAEEIRDEEIVHRALYFLRKVYNFDFAPAFETLQRESEMFHPFRQIWYANSLEGAAVFNNCSSTDPEFIRTFYTNSFPKSLWLTVLGVMQRSVFLQLMKEVTRIDPDNHQLVKEYLIRYTRISLKAIFSKVSVYHQHNDYYVMMINNFQINELQTELKDELYDLNNVLRQSHEDEVEKHDQIEKQSDKRFSMILFVLSIFGLIEVIYKVIENKEMTVFEYLLAFGIPLGLGIVFWNIIFRRKKQ